LLNDRAVVGYGLDLSVSQRNNAEVDRVRTELSEANLDGLVSDFYVFGLRRDFAADQERAGPGGDNVSQHFSA